MRRRLFDYTNDEGELMHNTRFATRAVITIMAVSTLGACATKGFVRRGLDEQRVALGNERGERMMGDSANRADVNAVRTELRNELTALRADLGTLRTEFGTRITAMEGQVTFAMPVHFEFDASAVRSQDEAALAKFAQVAGAHYKGSTITVEGFADPAGGVNYNLQLSRARAEAVREYLVSKGIDASRIRSVGYGKSRLVRPGAERNDPGAELNRRVTFVVETAPENTVAALSMR